MPLAELTIEQLVARLEVVKGRALSDAFAVEQEFCVGPDESQSAAEDYEDTQAVIEEVIRRLTLLGGL